MRTVRTHFRGLAASVALLAVAVVVAVGLPEPESGQRVGPGNPADAAFVSGMVSHHAGAIAMAKLAERRAERPQLRRFAAEVIAAQASEMEVMGAVGHDIRGAGDHRGAHTDHTSGALASRRRNTRRLAAAQPFDRAFIDTMVAHHRQASRMARTELTAGEHPVLRKMAAEIVAARGREIAQLRAWRRQWYGAGASAR